MVSGLVQRPSSHNMRVGLGRLAVRWLARSFEITKHVLVVCASDVSDDGLGDIDLSLVRGVRVDSAAPAAMIEGWATLMTRTTRRTRSGVRRLFGHRMDHLHPQIRGAPETHSVRS